MEAVGPPELTAGVSELCPEPTTRVGSLALGSSARSGFVVVANTDISARNAVFRLDRRREGLGAIQASRAVLLVSLVMLAVAPLFIPDTYSPIEHTISESGAQGIPGAWVERFGVFLAACAVLVMTFYPGPTWSRAAQHWLRVYSFAVVMLAVFPESPWDGGTHDETIARMHTVMGVAGAVSFVMGVVVVSSSRQRSRRARRYDALVVVAVVLVPQLMLLGPLDGILQRLMVAVGYGWLFLECKRKVDSRTGPSLTP
jgi:hypothetical protein